mgnify:CR=1 FL=1
MVISFIFISRSFFLYSLNELENMEMTRASDQAKSVINIMIADQQEHSYDWANWDETYQLLQDGDTQTFRSRNLYLDTLNTLALDLMVFVTLEGDVIEHLSRKNDPNHALCLVSTLMSQQSIKKHIASSHNTHNADANSIADLFRVDNEVWAVSVTPIRNSEATKPSVGWLVWGKNLTKRFPGEFQSILSAQNRLALSLPDDMERSAQVNKATTMILRQGDSIVQWSPLSSNDRSTVAFLVTKAPREHFHRSSSLFAYLFMAVGLSTTVIAGGSFVFFKKGVATRFNTFEKGINLLFDKYQLSDQSSGKADELDRATQLVEALTTNALVAEGKVLDTQQKYRALYESKSVGLLVVLESKIIDLNNKTLDLLGYTREALICQSLATLCSTNEYEYHLELLYHQLSNGQLSFEAQLVARNGDIVDCQIEAASIQHNGQNALLFLIHDMGIQKKQQALIEELSGRDPVSGLKNRPTILKQVSQLIESEPNRFSLMYIAIENLKQVSAIYGHLVFDDAIRHATGVFNDLLSHYRVGRISEFEFIAIIPTNADAEQALDLGNKLIDTLTNKTEICGLAIDLNCKVVMVERKLTHHSLAYLLQAAYYSAQSEHGHQSKEVIMMSEGLSEDAQTALKITRELESAISGGQIGVLFQPIIDTKSEQINGFEALARWFHPTLGTVSPDVFIPLAEQNNLIVQLGESVLRQSCAFIHHLNQLRREQGLSPLSIHVNLSAKHFYHTDLTDHLTQVMDEFELCDSQLVVELTESMLMGVEAETIARMNEIKQLGIQLALDDFGTGYASFSTLIPFPLDMVKLDKSYIDQIETSERAEILVRNLANMTQELGLITVAEGVESLSQVHQLREWNIDEIQGYYFYKPMSAQQATKLFTTALT